mgnify:CR=1 FL=1
MEPKEEKMEIEDTTAVKMKSYGRPLVSPEAFSGSTSWTDWIEHFEAVAVLNDWDDAAKLRWLPVRLSGKAQTAWKRLSPEVKADYETAREALEKRFEPESKRSLYFVEFQARRRKKEETWSDFADELRVLADKALPEIEDKAKELLTIERFLGELTNPQVAFAVRQRQPKTLDDAVACTLETESYLLRGTMDARVAAVTLESNPESASFPAAPEQETVLKLLQSLSLRMEKIEKTMERASEKTVECTSAPSQQRTRGDEAGTPPKCFRCGQVGHYARGCAVKGGRRQQGN